MNNYSEWNKVLCKQLCEYMECFENDPTIETLCVVEKLAKTIVKINEMEAYGSMRKYIEKEFGYDSETGEFKDEKGYGDWKMYGYYNAYTPMMRSTPYNPTMGGGYGRGEGSRYGERSTDKAMYPYSGWMNAANGSRGGNDGRSGSRSGSQGNRSGNMSGSYQNHYEPYEYDDMDYDDEDYMWMNASRGGSTSGTRRRRDSMGRYMNAAERKETKEKIKKLSEEERREWLENLENSDGSTGAMWKKEETTAVAKKIGVKFDEFSESDFNVAMNLMYSDYCSAIEKTDPEMNKPEVYARLAKAFLEDEDGPDGAEKLSLYFKNIVEADDD